jgi:hypothetical protein
MALALGGTGDLVLRAESASFSIGRDVILFVHILMSETNKKIQTHATLLITW